MCYSATSGHNPRAGDAVGGSTGYPIDRLFEEVSFIAYHFHWALPDILNLEHADRHQFIEQISAINRQMNQAAVPAEAFSPDFIPLDRLI